MSIIQEFTDRVVEMELENQRLRERLNDANNSLIAILTLRSVQQCRRIARAALTATRAEAK